jgi:hypothetical protein
MSSMEYGWSLSLTSNALRITSTAQGYETYQPEVEDRILTDLRMMDSVKSPNSVFCHSESRIIFRTITTNLDSGFNR